MELSGGYLLQSNPSSAGLEFRQMWDLSEIPMFVKSGAIIPSVPGRYAHGIGSAQSEYPALAWSIYPGSSQGSLFDICGDRLMHI